MLFQCLEDCLVDLDVVSDHCNLFRVEHVDFIVPTPFVLAAHDHDCLVDTVAQSVQMSDLLLPLFEPKVFGVLASVELYDRHAVPAIEARVLALRKLVELVNYVVKVLAKGPETDSELLLLLPQVHEGSEERWDDVVPPLGVKLTHHLFVKRFALLLPLCVFVIRLVPLLMLYFRLCLFWFHAVVARDAELVLGSFRQRQIFHHFVQCVFKL